MKILKLIGLFCLFCFTFIYTEKIINVSIEQDEIMIKIKEYTNTHNINPINAIINEDTIIPGNIGKYIDTESSYKKMKKYGYFNESLLIYKDIYPETSIYNKYSTLCGGSQYRCGRSTAEGSGARCGPGWERI